MTIRPHIAKFIKSFQISKGKKHDFSVHNFVDHNYVN